MAKFVYRMQNILNLHQKLENEAKIELTIANNALRSEEEKLQLIYEQLESYVELIREYSTKKLDVLELKRCNDAIALKKMEAEEQKVKIQKARKAVDKAMMKLQEIMRDRKTQETLKEKAFDEFVKELNDAELKEVDQIVSYQYNGTKE